MNLAELGAKMRFFRKIQNFIKSKRSDGFFQIQSQKTLIYISL